MPWNTSVSPRMILEDIARVFPKGELRPTFFRYRELGGHHGLETIRRCFGQWSQAVHAWEHDALLDEPAPSEEKPRECLRCDRSFLSAWAGERLCHRCREYMAKESYEKEYVMASPKILGVRW